MENWAGIHVCQRRTELLDITEEQRWPRHCSFRLSGTYLTLLTQTQEGDRFPSNSRTQQTNYWPIPLWATTLSPMTICHHNGTTSAESMTDIQQLVPWYHRTHPMTGLKTSCSTRLCSARLETVVIVFFQSRYLTYLQVLYVAVKSTDLKSQSDWREAPGLDVCMCVLGLSPKGSKNVCIQQKLHSEVQWLKTAHSVHWITNRCDLKQTVTVSWCVLIIECVCEETIFQWTDRGLKSQYC